MRNLRLFWILFLSIFFLPTAWAQKIEWPREIVTPNANIMIYQPQPETFEGDHVTARSAVSVTLKDNPEPIFGAAWYDATIATNRDDRTVDYKEVKVTAVKFPEATPEQEQKFKDVVSREMTGWDLKGSLDRLLTTLKLAHQEQQISSQIDNAPPKIFYSEQPAVLVVIDGKPILKPVEASEIQQVVNTAFQIFFDPASQKYYLKGSPQWFSTSDIMGEWNRVEQVPEAVSRLASDVDSVVSSMPASAAPVIFVTTQPAELIQVNGVPQWAPIAGTTLSYLQNSDNAVFLQQPGDTYYALLSGRWFAAKPTPVGGPTDGAGFWAAMVDVLQVAVLKLPAKEIALADAMKGPWAFISGDKLPEDFRKIPSDFEKEGVLASIPGTEEAGEAVMDAQIPQTTVIDKRSASFTPTYDGAPKFEEVSATSMQYAVNTPNQIIKEGDKYYACDQGVWYVADKPEGPYQVSDTRPKDIDQIPPDNPNYNTKYVYVYDSDDDTVTTGYTAGYLGAFILGTTMGAAMTWGTGYYYRPWYGAAYYSRPWSYGYNAHYNPYTGGWGYRGPNGAAWYRPNNYGGANGYWGPGGYHNINADNININNVNVDRNQFNNNLYDRQQNLDRNLSGERFSDWERKQGNKLGEGGGLADRDPSRVAGNRPNDVFADKDGNVFRRDQGGQWQQNEGRDWNNVDRPEGAGDKVASRPGDGDRVQRDRPEAANRPAARPAQSRDGSFDRSNMEQQNHARERGNQRAQNYQTHASRGSGGSGMQRGGGGGGGGRSGGGGGGRAGGGGGGRRR
jgi:uncharacterized membrane protein YgcG